MQNTKSSKAKGRNKSKGIRKSPYEKTTLRRKTNDSYDVIVVGGGLFGTLTALRLAEQFKVLLLERNGRLLSEASSINQNRVHYGFHYPRSPRTAQESIEGALTFIEYFRPYMSWFENYYGVYKGGSMTSFEDYIQFADHLKTAYGIYSETLSKVPSRLCNQGMVDGLVKVDEPTVDMHMVKAHLEREIQKCPNLSVRMNTEALRLESTQPYVIKTSSGTVKAPFVVNASYGNLLWHGLTNSHRIELQLVEMIELESKRNIPGITLMDGQEGLSILPLGKKRNRYWWSSVKYSVHARLEVSGHAKFRTPLHSNWPLALKQGEDFFPFMKQLRYVRSHYAPRAFLLEPSVDLTAARPVIISRLDHGFLQVLSGKLTTSVSTAEEIAKMIKDISSSDSGTEQTTISRVPYAA